MDNSKYIDYVNTHVDEIAVYVDECFEQSKDSIKEKLICLIRDYLSPVPIHYVIKNDHNPYDSSGILVDQGYVSLDQTVKNFWRMSIVGIKKRHILVEWAGIITHTNMNYIIKLLILQQISCSLQFVDILKIIFM